MCLIDSRSKGTSQMMLLVLTGRTGAGNTAPRGGPLATATAIRIAVAISCKVCGVPVVAILIAASISCTVRGMPTIGTVGHLAVPSTGSVGTRGGP